MAGERARDADASVPERAWWACDLALVCVMACGCGTIDPPGFSRLSRSEPMAITATPWRAYGFAPMMWDLPDGRRIRVRIDRALVTSGGDVRRADLAFDVALESASSIRCETAPSGPVSGTRFGCWSGDDDAAFHRFWMARGSGCSSGSEILMETLTNPACWVGDLTTSGQRYVVRYGYLETSDAAIDRIAWVDSTDATVLAADLVSEMRIDLFPRSRSLASIDDSLLLQTVALHWWGHAASR
ncbi:MAG: hypothetical protein HYY06_08500 [Deltaproteobacteria bacterium]|nr:hypothetical protein [Deltaproteobacteria bacterium]